MEAREPHCHAAASSVVSRDASALSVVSSADAVWLALADVEVDVVEVDVDVGSDDGGCIPPP